jgi:hypothetical protein
MANDFSGDANCAALWRMESGALITDSKSTNTLTDHNTVQDAPSFKEGANAAYFVRPNSECLYIADASLSAGFPLKSGDSVKIISFAFWFQYKAISSTFRPMITKWDSGGTLRCFLLGIIDATNKYLQLMVSTNGDDIAETINPFSGLTIDRWYHLGFTYVDSTKAWTARLWDDVLSSAADASGSLASSLFIGAAAFALAGYMSGGSPIAYGDCYLDEVVIFKDVLSSAEIDQIRSGTYGAGGASISEDSRGIMRGMLRGMPRGISKSLG